jgi:hypothetical protein
LQRSDDIYDDFELAGVLVLAAQQLEDEGAAANGRACFGEVIIHRFD